jgi:hypothetical protein
MLMFKSYGCNLHGFAKQFQQVISLICIEKIDTILNFKMLISIHDKTNPTTIRTPYCFKRTWIFQCSRRKLLCYAIHIKCQHQRTRKPTRPTTRHPQPQKPNANPLWSRNLTTSQRDHDANRNHNRPRPPAIKAHERPTTPWHYPHNRTLYASQYLTTTKRCTP